MGLSEDGRMMPLACGCPGYPCEHVPASLGDAGHEFGRAERFADVLREISDFDPLTFLDPEFDPVHWLQMKAREALLHG
jgi:hypothetical protein